MTRAVLCSLAIVLTGLLTATARADEADGRLDVYFIDVEGGAATLIVTPGGESVLIDSGYPDLNGRDRDRILKVVRDVAKLTQIDHAAVTHWHLDHYGNHASIAALFKIENFWDRGIPAALQEDKKFEERIANYRAATQNASATVMAGEEFQLESPRTPLSVKVVTASREVIANTGQPNPFAKEHVARPIDKSDNAASISLLLQFGKFKFLCCGDLTWNIEGKLVTPNNPLGQVDMFMVTHHGLPSSNNPALVLAIDPVVAVMCNGPTKGGHPETIKTLRRAKSLKSLYQLHRNIKLEPKLQTPAGFILNKGTTADCQGGYIKASVAPDGASYTLQLSGSDKVQTYLTR